MRLGRLHGTTGTLNSGSGLKTQGDSGYTLQAASFGGYDSIVRLLLKWGADVNAQGGRTAGSIAIRARPDRLVTASPWSERTSIHRKQNAEALYIASSTGHDVIVRLLLEQGAEVNAQGRGYSTALTVASSEVHDSVVRLLLKAASVGGIVGYRWAGRMAGQCAALRGHDVWSFGYSWSRGHKGDLGTMRCRRRRH